MTFSGDAAVHSGSHWALETSVVFIFLVLNSRFTNSCWVFRHFCFASGSESFGVGYRVRHVFLLPWWSALLPLLFPLWVLSLHPFLPQSSPLLSCCFAFYGNVSNFPLGTLIYSSLSPVPSFAACDPEFYLPFIPVFMWHTIIFILFVSAASQPLPQSLVFCIVFFSPSFLLKPKFVSVLRAENQFFLSVLVLGSGCFYSVLFI